MHDDWIVATALATSGLGIALLLFALILLEPPEQGIATAAASPDGTPLRITGTLEAVRTIGDRTIITISQPATIDVIVETANLTELKAGACVSVRGERGSYEGKPQIAATRVATC